MTYVLFEWRAAFNQLPGRFTHRFYGTESMRIVTFLTVLLFSCVAQSAIIVYEHLGTADPTTEGWQRQQFGPDFSEGPVFESATQGFDGWKIRDDHSGYGGDATELLYRVNIADEHVATATIEGWQLTARFRIADDPNMGFLGYHSSIGLVLSIQSKIYPLDFASYTGASVTILSNGTNFGPQFEVGGNGYHEYQLSYDPALDSVAFRVDGFLLTSNLPSVAISNGNYIEWGSSASQDVGQGNWNRVAFSVPEPTSSSYLLAAIVGFFLTRRGFTRPPRACD